VRKSAAPASKKPAGSTARTPTEPAATRSLVADAKP
jgi:hypothetical protein